MMLMEEAERISRDEHGSSKLAVISGEKQKQHRKESVIYLLLRHCCLYGGAM